VDHAVTDLEVARWQALLGEGGAGQLPARATAALGRWDAGPLREPGTRSYLELLRALGEVMAIERHRTTAEGGALVTEVSGKLTQSGRPVRVRLWLGLTDLFGPRPPAHWPALRRALAEDQIVVYWGHAGIG